MAGRAASTKVQPGDYALSVGFPRSFEPPDGWKWTPLNQLAEMATGHTPDRDKSSYWHGNIKWMCASDARFRHGGVVFETKESVTQAGLDNSAAVLLPVDTVCLARTGASIGYAVRLGETMATNQGFVNWVCGPSLLPTLLQYALVAEIAFLKRIAYGAAHHTIYFPELKALQICVPPLAEQQRIVGILDEAFAGIATAKANAEKNLRNARDLFESELAAVFAQKDNSHPEKQLDEVCEDITVGHVGSMKTQYRENGIPFLRSQNIRPFRVSLDGLVFIDNAFHGSLRKSELRPGDVAIVRTGYPGTAAVIPETLGVANCSDLVIVRPGPLADPHYLALFFNSSFGKELVGGRLVGAAQKHFNVGAAKKVRIAFPSIPEQRRMVKAMTTLSVEIQRLESLYQRKLAALDELKKSLLHQAFSGQL